MKEEKYWKNINGIFCSCSKDTTLSKIIDEETGLISFNQKYRRPLPVKV